MADLLPRSGPVRGTSRPRVGALALRTTVDRMSASGPVHDLGVRTDADGGGIRVWSEHATSIDLTVVGDSDLDWAVERTPLARGAHGVWEGRSAKLVPGARYGL